MPRSSRFTKRTPRTSFVCNICGQSNSRVPLAALQRETPSCRQCGSTVRFRAVIRLLSLELFAESLPLADFPERLDITGVGMSDWHGYAERLAAKVDYTNTFYHQEPRMDITSIDGAHEDLFDFVISSDVFEHVPPPVSRAFSGMFRLLKPGGLAIFTVPWVEAAETVEHFPRLHAYEIVQGSSRPYLRNVTSTGEVEYFDELVFHGGDGATLEMRRFAGRQLLEHFSAAGFTEIRIRDDPDEAAGIVWLESWSLPLTARRPHRPDSG
jgi:SAM-dependent methyltransferase